MVVETLCFGAGFLRSGQEDLLRKDRFEWKPPSISCTVNETGLYLYGVIFIPPHCKKEKKKYPKNPTQNLWRKCKNPYCLVTHWFWRHLSVTRGTAPSVTYVPVTRRNFKLSSFLVMAASFRSLPASNNNKWYFTRQEIDNNPSRRAGLDPDKELSYRQQAANLIQDMGQRLNVYLLSCCVARS